MFKLHRHKSDRSGDRIDFKFSSFNAIQVPKGWDKLVVSLVSADTGRTISKLGKASVRNGTCRWTETITETIWIVQNDGEKQDRGECRWKFVVAMGSSRSGILGESYVNLSHYASSRATVPLSLHLSKCDHGTTLQFKIQCLTPRSKVRDEQRSVSNSQVPYVTPGYDDTETKSDVSDGSFSRSMGSSSSNHVESTTQAELSSRDPTFSASSSRHSYDSTEGSSNKDILSPRNSLFSVANNLIGRQDSAGSQCSTPSYSLDTPDDVNKSNHSSFNPKVLGAASTHRNLREDTGENSGVLVTSPLQNADSSKDLLEAAEVTTEELRAEARMWERNAKKLMVEVDELKKKLSSQLKREVTLDMELSASQRECNNLKQEMEQLKSLLDELSMKEKVAADTKLRTKDMDEMQRQLEDEINSYKESNDNLAQQLQKTQESNIELLSILQELEGIVEAQKLEIENLSAQKSKSEDNEGTSQNPDVSPLKMGNFSCDLDIKGSALVHPMRESSSDLQIQLHDMLEKQNNLEGTIQMLEETLQDKNIEIEMEKELSTQKLQDSESKWRLTLAAKEEDILNLEAKLREAIKGCQMKVSELGNGKGGDLNEEVEFLKANVEELEKDCCELTEENLQLLLKLKESRKQMSSPSFLSSSGDSPADISTFASESDVSLLKSQLIQLQQELKRKDDVIEESVTSKSAKAQCTYVEKQYNELEIQLQTSKDEAFHLKHELQKCRVQVEAQVNEIHALQEQLQNCGTKDALTRDPQQVERDINCGSNPSTQSFHFLSELCEELHRFLDTMKKQQHFLHMTSDARKINSFDDLEAKLTESFTEEEQILLILKHLSELNKLSIAHSIGYDELQLSEKEVKERGRGAIVHDDMRDDQVYTSNQVSQSPETDPERTLEEPSKEIMVEISQTGLVDTDHLVDEEMELLRHNLTELESQVSSLQKENRQLEASLENMEREKGTASRHVEDLKNEMIVLNSEMKFQAGANKVLERKSADLEKGKQDLELQLSELEDENLQLSQRISALEAQLRHLTNEKEKCQLELRHFESQAMSLNEEIRKLENEMEAQKIDMKQKFQDMQKRWLDSQEECEFLKKANPKLQATTENLIEECAALQKSNGDLKRQNTELHMHNTAMDSQLKDTLERFLKCSEKVEALEAELSSMIEEIPLKEKSLNAELECLIHENKEQKENLVSVERLLNQVYADKMIEVENLQKELVHLIDQISAADVGKEDSSSEEMFKVSALRADKGKLEASLQELKVKYASCESKLATVQRESEAKVQELMRELNASKQNHSVLMADHDRLLVLLECIRSDEKRCKSIVNELELKFKASDYERLQLLEEISGLKLQLQKAGLLQDEVLALKNSLNNAKFENERMKASHDLLSGDYEQLKAEKSSLAEKISSIEKAMVELEDCRRSKIALEEKSLRLEGDLAAREVACSQDAELKIELSKFKRASNELLRQIKHLEEDKEDNLKRVRALEEELEQKNDILQEQSQPGCIISDLSGKSESAGFSTRDERHASGISDISSGAEGADYLLKIHSLENELAEALEANDMYKDQLRRFLSEEQNNDSDTANIAANQTKDPKRCDRDISSLEIELRDLRERYFQISLKYAEVEAQREELVLKLKSMNNRRSWFS